MTFRISVRMLAVTVLLPTVTSAQEAMTYRARGDTLYWVSDNPFRLFHLRDGDTVPGEVRGISVTSARWVPAPEGFQVFQESVDVGLNLRRTIDSMTVSRRGEVLTVNGGQNYDEGEWDGLLRLPDVPLTIGHEWSDTIAHPTEGPHGPGWFEVRRRYRVARALDSAGITGLEVVIEGELVFRLSMWTDSSAGRYRWFDLTGPTDERFVFDPAEGQLTLREWSMLLEGVGGDVDGVGSDTVPAGLRSANTRYRIPAERARALTAELPGTDTSVTVRPDGAALFMHTMGREPDRIVAGFRRVDGTTGTTEVELGQTEPVRWTFQWVDPRSDVRLEVISLEGELPSHDGAPLTPPTEAWGVAEYGMWGTVIPSLERLGQVQNHPFSVYRPTARTWDRVSATIRAFDDFSLVVLQSDSGINTVLVVDAAGLLLYQESLEDGVTRASRVPTSDERLAQLQQIIARLQDR